jgi:hypothetical protein
MVAPGTGSPVAASTTVPRTARVVGRGGPSPGSAGCSGILAALSPAATCTAPAW